jgi:hypothetical protein
MRPCDAVPGMKVCIKNPALRDIDGKLLYLQSGVFVGFAGRVPDHSARKGNYICKVRMDNKTVLTDYFYVKDLAPDHRMSIDDLKNGSWSVANG